MYLVHFVWGSLINIFNGMGANGRIFVVQASKRHFSAEGPGPLNDFDIHFLVHLQLHTATIQLFNHVVNVKEHASLTLIDITT